jgi:alpha-tubulin suppressor-like RCC1 family protein
VKLPVGPGTNNTVVTGDHHTCVIQTFNMAPVFCWGGNDSGQLGIGTNNPAFTPQQLPATAITGTVGLEAGLQHTCALRGDGAVFCWGRNSEGELGNGTLASISSPPTTPTLFGVQQLSGGSTFTCARLQGGSVDCWGQDSNGQLGDGTGLPQLTSPTSVLNLPPSASIGSGGGTTCSTGVDGNVMCWGGNGNGALANGTTTTAFTPTPLNL